MNLFDKAAAWLPSMVQAAAGGTVSYRRGATSITVVATLGQTVYGSDANGPVRVEAGDRDYLILVADLATFGVPQIGDRITDCGKVFECQTPGTGEKAWRYSDPTQVEYRLHMKQVV